jgi:hypothetical protein
MADFDTTGVGVEYLRVYSDPRFTLDRYREVLVEDSFLHRPVVVAGRASNGCLFNRVSGKTMGDKARGSDVFVPPRV